MVYIDLTNFHIVSFLSGIQRVVREVTVRLLKEEVSERVSLIVWNRESKLFNFVDKEKFLLRYEDGIKESDYIDEDRELKIADITCKDVFFDLDGCWNNKELVRSGLYDVLDRQGVRIITYVYDIIPVLMPQYSNQGTVFQFLNYLGAVILHSDTVIASTKATLDYLDELCDKLGVPHKDGRASWLGSEFQNKEYDLADIPEDIACVPEKGKYVLCVGTIEPRKNHAFLLDAYEQKLKDMGLQLVFAGRKGWNVDELFLRIENHPDLGKGFYLFQGIDDISLDFLYKNAYAVVFPTFQEGFGLPVVEALYKGVPVICSDIPVLREVGGDYCEYFPLGNIEAFSDILREYLDSPDKYDKKRKKIADYKIENWDTVTDRIKDILLEERNFEKPDFDPSETPLEQIVYLSARKADLLASLPFVENRMHFIKKLLVCCPDDMKSELESEYAGRLSMEIITDSELLEGDPLPEDHSTRNFLLRRRLMKNAKLDQQFVMCDDDARPIVDIEREIFIKNGRYRAYYFYKDIRKWTGDIWALTSYDKLHINTSRFLHKENLPFYMFSSHMPQVINKQIYNELLEKYPELQIKACDEWSVYFNYLLKYYPDYADLNEYVTLGWPGNETDWLRDVVPDKFLFENYYDFNYTVKGLFCGIPDYFNENSDADSKKKISIYRERMNNYVKCRDDFKKYSEEYTDENGVLPTLGILIEEDKLTITSPKYLRLHPNGFVRIPYEIRLLAKRNGKNEKVKIISCYKDKAENVYKSCMKSDIDRAVLENYCSKATYPIFPAGQSVPEELYFCISVKFGGLSAERSIPIEWA